MKKILLGGVVIILFGLAFSYEYFRVGEAGMFIALYHDYDTLWLSSEVVTHTPGAEKNTTRARLNTILSQVLNESTPPSARLALATEGLNPLAEIHLQIEDMKPSIVALDNSTLFLKKNTESIGGIRIERQALLVVGVAEKRQKMIHEVEEVSFRMNDSIKDIFQGIIADHGTLTNKRIKELNDQIPKAEKDFDRLNELYRNIDESKYEIEKDYSKFTKYLK